MQKTDYVCLFSVTPVVELDGWAPVRKQVFKCKKQWKFSVTKVNWFSKLPALGKRLDRGKSVLLKSLANQSFQMASFTLTIALPLWSFLHQKITVLLISKLGLIFSKEKITFSIFSFNYELKLKTTFWKQMFSIGLP